MPGVSFNFSQYIQDNIEEAVSGVKGANSVKIVGPNLETVFMLIGGTPPIAPSRVQSHGQLWESLVFYGASLARGNGRQSD